MFHHQQICIIRNKWSVKVDSEVKCTPYNVAHKKTYWVNEEIILSQKVAKKQNSQMVPDFSRLYMKCKTANFTYSR